MAEARSRNQPHHPFHEFRHLRRHGSTEASTGPPAADVEVAEDGRSRPATKTGSGVPVTVDNFVRAETDLYFSMGEFGKLRHARTMADIDR